MGERRAARPPRRRERERITGRAEDRKLFWRSRASGWRRRSLGSDLLAARRIPKFFRPSDLPVTPSLLLAALRLGGSPSRATRGSPEWGRGSSWGFRTFLRGESPP